MTDLIQNKLKISHMCVIILDLITLVGILMSIAGNEFQVRLIEESKSDGWQ